VALINYLREMPSGSKISNYKNLKKSSYQKTFLERFIPIYIPAGRLEAYRLWHIENPKKKT